MRFSTCGTKGNAFIVLRAMAAVLTLAFLSCCQSSLTVDGGKQDVSVNREENRGKTTRTITREVKIIPKGQQP